VTLQQLCAARGLTLEQLAERAGVARTTVVKVDAGTIRAQPVTLRRLGAVLGLAPAALQDELSAARRRRSQTPSPGGGHTSWR
jgi:transcriptional regulator with XRE-family HTH domain